MIHNKGYWPYTVKVGDVLVNAKGTERVVRAVTQDERSGYTTHVTFAIMHCSWTGRSYTVRNYVDLQMQGYKPTGVKAKMESQLDKLINLDCQNTDARLLTCCDVKGVR